MERNRNRKEERRTLSDFPDSILLEIMKFMDTKDAVQTCILSTRWKDLWRCLPSLATNFSDFSQNLTQFSQFVSSVLSHRDNSIDLPDIDLRHAGGIQPELLDRVMAYAVSHNVKTLAVDIDLIHFNFCDDHTLNPCIFSCPSLTYLKICILSVPRMIELPSSLHFMALKSLHLEHVTFVANEDGVADPFSNCHMLTTLVLGWCTLTHNTKFLCISNSKLSSLTIGTILGAPKVVLSTPNLSSLTLFRGLIDQVSTCNLSLLDQVNIDVQDIGHLYSNLINWLHGLADYIKILALSSTTLKVSSFAFPLFFFLFFSYCAKLFLIFCQC
jgi:hypothetical protein